MRGSSQVRVKPVGQRSVEMWSSGKVRSLFMGLKECALDTVLEGRWPHVGLQLGLGEASAPPSRQQAGGL